jgi:hypothetical protein
MTATPAIPRGTAKRDLSRQLIDHRNDAGSELPRSKLRGIGSLVPQR